MSDRIDVATNSRHVSLVIGLPYVGKYVGKCGMNDTSLVIVLFDLWVIDVHVPSDDCPATFFRFGHAMGKFGIKLYDFTRIQGILVHIVSFPVFCVQEVGLS